MGEDYANTHYNSLAITGKHILLVLLLPLSAVTALLARGVVVYYRYRPAVSARGGMRTSHGCRTSGDSDTGSYARLYYASDSS